MWGTGKSGRQVKLQLVKSWFTRKGSAGLGGAIDHDSPMTTAQNKSVRPLNLSP